MPKNSSDCVFCSPTATSREDTFNKDFTLIVPYFHRTTESQNCRVWKGLLEITESNSVYPSPAKQAPNSRLHREMSRRVLNISKEGQSANSLGSLFQCSVNLTLKKFLHRLVRTFLCSSLWPFPLVLSPQTTEKRLAMSLWLPHLNRPRSASLSSRTKVQIFMLAFLLFVFLTSKLSTFSLKDVEY